MSGAIDEAASDRDVQGLLGQLVNDAAEMVGQPLRPAAENLAGYVETVWPERPGVVWLTGWVRRDVGQELPVVIADRRKVPGAIAMACYDREDLPPEAHAFVAVLQTDWAPSRDTTDVFIFFGPAPKHFIRSVSPLRVQDGKGFAAEFTRVQAICHAGRVNALRSMLLGGQNWIPDTAELAGAALQAATDEILVLPGFGCFIQGWLLCPTKRLVRLSLKLADRVLHSVPGSLYFVPRPDLASAMPNVPALLDRAGFAAVLTGPLQPEDLIAPVLKAWFSDGTAVNLNVDPVVIRRLGHAVPYSDALRLFPGLAQEAFFPGCAAALRREVLGRLAEAQPLNAPWPGERCLVAALPSQPSDARLMVDQIARHLARRPAPPAVALLVEQGKLRAQLPLLSDVVQAATGVPCSAFVVEDTGRPLLALGTVLQTLGAERFLFLGAGRFPDSAAWTSCLAALEGVDTRPHLARVPETRGLAALAWTTAGFLGQLEAVDCPLGSGHEDAVLALDAVTAGGARATGLPPRPDRLLESVDQARRAAEAMP